MPTPFALRSALALCFASALFAQSPCGSQLQTLDVPSGLDGALHDSVLWDRDGSGPLPAELVIGGAFRRVGGVVANSVARLDAALGWQPLGAGCDGAVFSLAIDGANRLVVGGSFTTAGGVTAPRIARFDGAQWTALASPPPALVGQVTALAPLGASELSYVESAGLGYFDGTSAFGVALGPASGSFGGSATDVARLPNGDLLIAGSFSSVAGQPANNVAIYEWATGVVRTLQGGANNLVRDVEPLPNGEFFAFGTFTTVGGGVAAGGVARWTAAGWQPYPSPMLLVGISGGGVNAAGEPIAFGTLGSAQYVAGAWQTIFANAVFTTHAQLQPNGALLFGTSTNATTVVPPFGYFAQGGTARPVADGVVGSVLAAAETRDGSIVAYVFTSAASTTPALSNLPAPGGFVRYGAAGWTVEPTGARPQNAIGAPAQVNAILPQDDGSYIVAGTFTSIGGVAAIGVARFDGTSWQPVGGLGGAVNRAVQLPNGDLVVLMVDQSIRRFDGAQWLTVATAAAGEGNIALAACRDGAFVVLRRTSGSPGLTTLLDRWVGATRTSTAVPGAPTPQEVVELRDGSIALTTSNSGVLRYDGATFQTLGALATPNAIGVAALPDGGLVANIASGAAPQVRTTLRWDGTAWTPLHASGFVKPIALRNGDVLIVGTAVLDATRVAAAARFATGCPSAANAVAPGCASPAGDLASDAPWLGQTLRLQASGLPNAAFAITVGSTQAANLPLASVFATALPGCALLVQPDVTTVQLAVNGEAQLAFVIPNVPALAGAAFRQQVVSFALDPSLAVGATNALDLVVGSY